MTPKAIADFVDRGIEIRRELKTLKAELESIEEKLQKAGLEGEQVDLKDADREGRRFLARGSSAVVPIIFTADKLMQTFAAESAQAKKIRSAAGGFFQDFYKPVNSYETLFKDGKVFRAHARALLDASAPAFITSCLARDKHGVPKSDIKIGWEDSEEITEMTK